MDKKQKSQFVKFFLVSLVLLAASFCWHEIANPTFFSRLPNVSATEAIYLAKRFQFSAMLWFTAGAYIMGFAILKLKKSEKNEEQEVNEKQEMDEK